MRVRTIANGEHDLARLFVIVGGMLVLVLTAALVAPYFVDWGGWRADFEREASRILGRDVIVRGSASARLLPFPSVTFTDVVVAGDMPGEPAMTVETFSMDAELAPFLSGEVLIFDMRVERPTALVTIGEDGTIDWSIRPSTPFDPGQVRLERVTVTEGSALIRHAASGREHELTGIDAIVSAGSLLGPWRIDGSARLDGIATDLAISTGRAVDGRMRMRLRADPRPYAFHLEADGDVGLEGGAGGYEGTFRVTGRAQAPDVQGGPPPVPANRASGRFALDHERLDIQELRFETGPTDDPYVAEGTAAIELGAEPSFHISADGAQVRLADAGEESGALALAARLAAFRQAVTDLPRARIPGTVDVALPALVVGDTTVRDVRLSASPAPEGWRIASLSASLPGRSTLEGSGLLSTGDADFGFEGELLLAVQQPSGFAAWLGRDVDEAIRRLPAAGFSARVSLSDRRQALDDLELLLGGARFTGHAVAERRGEGDPALSVDLEGGRLDLDGLVAFASLFLGDTGPTRLAGSDLDLALKAGPVTVGGVTAERVDTRLRLKEQAIEIDRLAITGLAGSSVSAIGTVRGLGGALEGTFDATLIAEDAAPLVSLLAERLPGDSVPRALAEALSARAAGYPGLFGETDLRVVASLSPAFAEDRRLSLELAGLTGGTHLDLLLDADGTEDAPRAAQVELKLSARNEEGGALMALAGLPALSLLDFDLPAQLSLEASGRPGEGLATRLSAGGPGSSFTFDGSMRTAETGMAGEGAVALRTGDMLPWLLTAGVALPGVEFVTGLPVELDAHARIGADGLVLSGLTGGIAGSVVDGELSAALRDGTPHFSGTLNLARLDLAPALAGLLGTDALEGGQGVWPETPFTSTVILPATFDVAVEADAAFVGDAFEAREVAARLRLDRDGLALSDLKAQAMGGRLSGLAELRNDAGTGLLSAQLMLDGAPVSRLVPSGSLSGTARIGGSVSSSGKSVDALVAGLSGSGSAAVDNLLVGGLAGAALPALLARADAEGTEIDAARTAAFAPGIIGAGSFSAGDGEVALTVAGGVVRAAPVHFDSEAATLTAEVRGDLSERAFGATGTLTYAPGDEALVGSEPVVGYTAQIADGAVSASLDTAALAQFLTQRALEREQRRVEAMQAQLLERQRLRREVRYFAALAQERERLAEQERERLAAEERERAAEEQRRAEEQARQVEEEARRLEAERQAQAARQEAERRAEQERRAAEPPVEVERAPLDPPPGISGAFDPDAIQNLLRSLQ